MCSAVAPATFSWQYAGLELELLFRVLAFQARSVTLLDEQVAGRAGVDRSTQGSGAACQ